MKTVIFIVGPTSSGKTPVAIKLAEELKGEIISCDSMQVYKDMDVITRAPSDKLLLQVPHHLVKELSPEKEYSAAKFTEKASSLIKNILSKGKVPIITGGTGLYMKSLLDGLFPAPPKDEELRKGLEKQAEEEGSECLYRRLEEIDPKTALGLHPNDLRRIIRALEVYELTGETIHDRRRGSKGIVSEYNCRIFGMELPRDILYERIDKTVNLMFEEGLVEAVKKLNGCKLSSTAVKALGIKEIKAFLGGNISLEDASSELKKNTRRYAKRQLTWFRADKRVEWVDANRDINNIIGDIIGRLQ
jgi:tRNA dimethylallyltransferase